MTNNINLSDRSFAAYSDPSEPGTDHPNPPQPQSRTAPGRLEAHDTDSEEEHFNLKKVSTPPSSPSSMNVFIMYETPAMLILRHFLYIKSVNYSISID